MWLKRIEKRLDNDPGVKVIVTAIAAASVALGLLAWIIGQFILELAREVPPATRDRNWLDGPYEEAGALSLEETRGRLSGDV